jgi:hypothetical protein
MQGEIRQAIVHPQEPLTPAEMEPLWRSERQATWLQVVAMAGFLFAGLAANRFGDLAWLNRPVLAAAVVLLFAASVLHIRARCPRCHTRLRSRILKMLPDKCARCGVAFPHPPSADG